MLQVWPYSQSQHMTTALWLYSLEIEGTEIITCRYNGHDIAQRSLYANKTGAINDV